MVAENVKVWHLCEVNKVNYNKLRRDVKLSSLIFRSLEGRGLRGVGPRIGKSRGEFLSVG
jgi:hypothetical protein